jgi:hypothetical protein
MISACQIPEKYANYLQYPRRNILFIFVKLRKLIYANFDSNWCAFLSNITKNEQMLVLIQASVYFSKLSINQG